MADEPPRAYGRGAFQIPSGFSGVLILLTVGLVVAFLYFARDVIVPIALAVLLSFLLAPAVRWLRRWHIGRVTAVTLTVLIAFLAMIGFCRSRRAGNILAGTAAAGVPFEPRGQNPLAAGGRTRRWGVAPRHINGPGTRQGTEAIRNRDLHLCGRPLCHRRFITRAGEACTRRDPAAGIRTPANRPEHRRSIASTAGNGRSGHRVCRHDLARAGGLCETACSGSPAGAICTGRRWQWTTRRAGSAGICRGSSSSTRAAVCRSDSVSP